MPTGGVSLENMAEWFDAGVTAVGVGGNLLAPAKQLGILKKVREVAQAYMEKNSKQSKGCRYMGKVVTLGEIMLRLSTPVGIRVAQTEKISLYITAVVKRM